jgi:hypothetical protein
MARKRFDKRLFEVDRRMELKMRLAAKRAAEPTRTDMLFAEFAALQDREIVDRLIDKVRRL